MKICNLNVKQNEKLIGYIDLQFSKDKLPVTVIRGKEGGKTVLITGGIHNAEYVGIECAIKLAEFIEPDDIKGTVIIIPIVNVNGFEHRTVSTTFEDGKNLNRVFPGNPDGTYSDQLAYFIEKELFSIIDYYIDIHNGDWFEELTPFIYCVGNASDDVVNESEQMALQADVPYYLKSSLDYGGAYNYAGKLGIPSVLIERGCSGLWSEKERSESFNDAINILSYINVFISDRYFVGIKKHIPRLLHHVHYIDSDEGGRWFPFKKAGDVVLKGESIGVIKDYFGNVLKTYIIEENCIILYQTVSYSVPKNSPLIAYGHFDDCINNHIHEHKEIQKEIH